MNKILLASALVASFGANAAIIDNDVNQTNIATLQSNGVIELSLVSLGDTNLVGTNLVNTSTATTTGLIAAVDNDVNQVALLNGQVNGVVGVNGIDLGNTTVIGLNSVNASTQTAGAVGPVAFVSENDTNQLAIGIGQGNGVLNAAFITAGNISVDGTNLVNTAEQNIGGAGLLSVVAGNDINQGAFGIGQGNGVANVALASFGNINVKGVNAVNSAEQNVGSLGIIVDGVVDNDISQTAQFIGQQNGVFDAGILNAGNISLAGVNLVNVATKTTLGAGLIQGVVDNDIMQNADDITQANTVTSVGALRLGNVTVDGTNAVNIATAEMTSLALIQLVEKNNINQAADNIGQSNNINVGASVSIGNLELTGTNVVNQASHVINVGSVLAGVARNEVDQTAFGIAQDNTVNVVAGANVGAITVTGSNSINTAILDINMGSFGVALDNNITQVSAGNVQSNGVNILAGIQAGPVKLTGTNSINAASLSVTQP